nr:S9 family peptidase [Acidobacteriota bacterium]
EELLFQQDGNNNFAAASKDGKQIVVSRSGTELSLDNNLYLIDAVTKKETLLTPHTDASSYGDVDFLPDGKTIVFTTDQNREFTTVATMSLNSDKNETSPENASKIQFVNTGIWDVENIEISPRGNDLAYTVNLEGFSRLVWRKIETGGDPKTSDVDKNLTIINLPAKGIVGGLNFSGDGSKLTFTFNSAKNNSDIWIWDLKQKSKMQVTKSDRAGISQDSFVEPELIKYKTFDSREIPAWFYKPKNFVGSFPVIVSVHGGPEGQERPGFNPLYQYYLSRGYAILATNVRGSTGYGKTFTHLDDVRKREDSVKDLAYAVEWLKTSGSADAKRIAVMGGSYGGYMTLAAITLYPNLWAAAVDTVGIANWESFLKNTSGYRRRQREVEYGRLDRDLDFLRRISPLAKIDKIRAPLFVIHGKNDPRVPYTEAEQIVAALRKRGGRVEYKLFDDEGHGVSKLKNRLELYPLVADFLDRNMK